MAVTFRKGMFTAPSSVRFAAKASSSAGNNNNCDESSKREVQFDYSENTDPVVNAENFIAPDFGYKRQYKGEIICIFGWSRECLRRRHTFTHLFSSFFTRRYQKQLVAIYSTRAKLLAASVTTITSAATSSFANAIYRLEVTTGACRGAGTSGRVNVILIGQDGLTYPFDLEYTAGDAPGFARGSTLPFRVAGAFRTDSEGEGEIVAR